MEIATQTMHTKPQEENETMSLEIKNGILFGQYIASSVDLKQAKELVAFRLNYCEHRDFPVIISGFASVKINKEARQYLGSLEAQQHISACAFVANNPVMMLLATLFLKLDATVLLFPCRVFRNQKAAVKWIKNKTH
jgi:hypothetical protein